MKQDFLVLMRTLHHNDAGGKGIKNRGWKREEGTEVESDDREDIREGRMRVKQKQEKRRGRRIRE